MSGFYRIKADRSKLRAAAKATDEYVKLLKDNMRAARGDVNELAASWKGGDATEFMTKWNGVEDQSSVYGKMIKSFESYASFLRYAEKRYRTAQVNAVSRADRLLRF